MGSSYLADWDSHTQGPQLTNAVKKNSPSSLNNGFGIVRASQQEENLNPIPA